MKLHVHIHFTNPDPFPRYTYFPYMLIKLHPKSLDSRYIYIFRAFRVEISPLSFKFPPKH